MITFLTWLLIIGGLAYAGFWLTDQWEARQEAEAAKPVTTEAPAATAQATAVALWQKATDWRTTLWGAKPPEFAPKFRAWMEQGFVDEPHLYEWLADLSDEQLNALTTHLHAFSHEMGFDLAWLLDQEFAQQPALAQDVTKVIVSYCQACYQAVLCQKELEPYRLLREYEQNPHSPQQQAFGQTIFGQLMAQGLTSVSIAEHLALPEGERRQQIVAELSHLATAQRPVVLRTVQAMVAQRNGGVAVAPAPVIDPVIDPVDKMVNGSVNHNDAYESNA
ncbi:MAG: hypothetical protein KF832_06945 [Caldilineaceae bacterium]|nr:hypothetical protein [Caldilineaceae bacterium]